MRAHMQNKPANFPREYVEVHLTTTEKKLLKMMADKKNMKMGQYIRFKMFKVAP